MRKILVLVVAGLSLSLVTCGGSDGGGGGSLCQQIGTMLCAKACACRDGAECAMSQGDPSAGGSVELTFDSEADCTALYVTLGCSMGDAAAYMNAAACLPLVEAASCTGSGTTGALAFPTDPACESP